MFVDATREPQACQSGCGRRFWACRPTSAIPERIRADHPPPTREQAEVSAPPYGDAHRCQLCNRGTWRHGLRRYSAPSRRLIVSTADRSSPDHGRGLDFRRHHRSALHAGGAGQPTTQPHQRAIPGGGCRQRRQVTSSWATVSHELRPAINPSSVWSGFAWERPPRANSASTPSTIRSSSNVFWRSSATSWISPSWNRESWCGRRASRSCVQEVVDILHPQSRRQRVSSSMKSPQTSGPHSGRAYGAADSVNLLGNGVRKFTESGQVHLRSDAGRRIGRRAHSPLVLRYPRHRNRHPGGQLERLFLPVCSSTSSMARRFGGAGPGGPDLPPLCEGDERHITSDTSGIALDFHFHHYRRYCR